MMDIGAVYYTIREGGGFLDALWHSTRFEHDAPGTGIARGDTSNGFAGDYQITYYYPDGTVSAELDLIQHKNKHKEQPKQETKPKEDTKGTQAAGTTPTPGSTTKVPAPTHQASEEAGAAGESTDVGRARKPARARDTVPEPLCGPRGPYAPACPASRASGQSSR
ncbi:MAG: hypothetical protein AAF439_02735 [Pseudomonadota bacterium]